jgi:hypothetical protein
VFTDAAGRCLEVIVLDRLDGHGPQKLIRASWRGTRILIGPGYYLRIEDALPHVDVESLVEVISIKRLPLPFEQRQALQAMVREPRQPSLCGSPAARCRRCAASCSRLGRPRNGVYAWAGPCGPGGCCGGLG